MMTFGSARLAESLVSSATLFPSMKTAAAVFSISWTIGTSVLSDEAGGFASASCGRNALFLTVNFAPGPSCGRIAIVS